VRAADHEDMAQAVALAILHNPLAPLGAAHVVAHPLAGVDEIAAGGANQAEVAHLAADRRRGRLVEAVHALGDGALAHQRQALQRQPDHLHVDHAQRSSKLRRLSAAAQRCRGIV
jgi:hypothetical protein